MKILFVRPRYDDGFGMKPLGLAILSAIAKAEGHQTSLFDTGYIEHELGSYHYLNDLRSVKIMKPVDFSAYALLKPKISLRESLEENLKEKPDLLAFSVIYGQHFIAEKLSKYAKEFDPNISVIWGGPYVTVDPGGALQRGADYACVGDGLIAFAEFLKAMESGRDPSGIANLWCRRNAKIIRNPLGPLETNLDALPYLDWGIFRKHDFLKPYDGKVLRGGDHMIAWGCINRCSYCINEHYQDLYKQHGHRFKIRRYSVDRIVSELKYQKDLYDLQMYKFCDENFLLVSLPYLREFAKKYAECVGLPFTTACHPKLVTEEKIALLKEAGCVSLSIGIESGNSEYRKNILNRPDSIEDIKRAFSLAKNSGIRTMAFNMFGLPFYTRKIYEETIALNRQAGVEVPTASFFYPFKGTKLRDTSIKHGFYSEEMDALKPYMKMAPTLTFENLSEDQLKQMFSVFTLYIKLPECYHTYIKRSEVLDSLGARLRTKLIEIYDNTVWRNGTGKFIDDNNGGQYLAKLQQIMAEEKI